MLILPLCIGHAIHRLAPFRLVDARRFSHPVAKAVAAESGQPHQINILCIGAVLKVSHQAPEGRSGNRIIHRFNIHVCQSCTGIPLRGGNR